MITQKTQYALRALFELARNAGKGPIKISAISRVQAIPVRFLEVILHRLKRGGLVESKRGFQGGYFLIRPPEKIRLGDVIRHMQENVGPVHCMAGGSPKKCPLDGECAFFPVWNRVRKSVFQIYDETTIQDLLDQGNPAVGAERSA